MENHLLLLAIGVAALGVIATAIRGHADKKTPRLPYAKRNVLSTPEQKLLQILVERCGSRYAVFPQVHLESLMHVERGTGAWRTHFNRIIQKSVDFAICDKETSAPTLVIELDDLTHARPERISRDSFVDAACKSAGIPILHVRVSQLQDTDAIAMQIDEMLKPSSIPER